MYNAVIAGSSAIDIFVAVSSLVMPCLLLDDKYLDEYHGCTFVDEKYAIIVCAIIVISFVRVAASRYSKKLDVLLVSMNISLSGLIMMLSLAEMATYGSNGHLLMLYYSYMSAFLMNIVVCCFDIYAINREIVREAQRRDLINMRRASFEQL